MQNKAERKGRTDLVLESMRRRLDSCGSRSFVDAEDLDNGEVAIYIHIPVAGANSYVVRRHNGWRENQRRRVQEEIAVGSEFRCSDRTPKSCPP